MGCPLAPAGEYDCKAAMRPYVKLLRPFVIIVHYLSDWVVADCKSLDNRTTDDFYRATQLC